MPRRGESPQPDSRSPTSPPRSPVGRPAVWWWGRRPPARPCPARRSPSTRVPGSPRRHHRRSTAHPVTGNFDAPPPPPPPPPPDVTIIEIPGLPPITLPFPPPPPPHRRRPPSHLLRRRRPLSRHRRRRRNRRRRWSRRRYPRLSCHHPRRRDAILGEARYSDAVTAPQRGQRVRIGASRQLDVQARHAAQRDMRFVHRPAAKCARGNLRVIAVRATAASNRARGAPRQKCGLSPKARWRTADRPGRTRWAVP